MKRDMDLVRFILMQIAESQAELQLNSLYMDRWTKSEVDYHVLLMTSAGLIDADLNGGWHGRLLDGTIYGLTWDGQDFLDSVANDRVWETVKKRVAETVGSVSMSTLKSVAGSVALASLGLK